MRAGRKFCWQEGELFFGIFYNDKTGNEMMKGDLHCHTRLSDGSEGIENVIAMAKRAGLDFIAITDHDTVASMSRAKVLGERYGIQVISGVEFSCKDKKRNRKVHMLCYLPDKPDRLEGLCNRICEQRKRAGKESIAKALKYFPITADDVLRIASHSTSIYKQHIMFALMCHGYTTHIFGGLFDQLFDPKNGLLYSSVEYPDVYDVIDLIHQSGGIAVLAHPFQYDSIDLLNELGEQKLIDGVEVYHSRCKQENEPILLELAHKYGLIVTGGSDFHGFYASRPCPIGCRYTPEESLDALYRLKEEKKKNK